MSGRTNTVCTGICPCEEDCPIGQALGIIGGKWKLRILCALILDGTLRYNDIRRKTVGITPAVLSAAMKDLEADGLVTRIQYEEIPPRVEYTVTKRGRALWPILHRLAHWAKGEEADPEGDSLDYARSGQKAPEPLEGRRNG